MYLLNGATVAFFYLFVLFYLAYAHSSDNKKRPEYSGPHLLNSTFGPYFLRIWLFFTSTILPKRCNFLRSIRLPSPLMVMSDGRPFTLFL